MSGNIVFLITDVNNFKGNNINMNNGSDALHFQPLLENIKLENIPVNTDDDLLFTMGDYTNYALGTTGNIENVYIRNVHVNNADQVLKLVGSGIGGKFKFKNISLENVTIITKFCVLQILKGYLADGNNYLKDIKLKNINFSNINVEFTQVNGQYFDLCAVEGDIIISKVNVNSQNMLRVLNVLKGSSLQKLTLSNITIKSNTAITNNILSFFVLMGRLTIYLEIIY
ncbi:hypothetical protein [Bacillus mycoides]|uniref:hypothetical protein n=1 Tax=Bacillus mycoides TaxID=1405 RepID=UPI003558FB6B